MLTNLQAFLRDEEGLTMVEYAVAGALISAAAVTAWSTATICAYACPSATLSPYTTPLNISAPRCRASAPAYPSKRLPNDVPVRLLPISFGGRAGGRAVVVCCNSLLGEPG